MKKLIILLFAIVPFFLSCEKEAISDNLIREIAWDALSENEKSTVIVDWKKAPVSEVTYMEKEAYSVTFNTSYDELLGPIIVYIEVASKVVLGKGLRD